MNAEKLIETNPEGFTIIMIVLGCLAAIVLWLKPMREFSKSKRKRNQVIFVTVLAIVVEGPFFTGIILNSETLAFSYAGIMLLVILFLFEKLDRSINFTRASLYTLISVGLLLSFVLKIPVIHELVDRIIFLVSIFEAWGNWRETYKKKKKYKIKQLP